MKHVLCAQIQLLLLIVVLTLLLCIPGIVEIKRVLVDSGYIDSERGRTTKLVKISGKPVRVISLYAAKLGLPETVAAVDGEETE